jgi:hypothetical protein
MFFGTRVESRALDVLVRRGVFLGVLAITLRERIFGLRPTGVAADR